jgi:hypothetical protein
MRIRKLHSLILGLIPSILGLRRLNVCSSFVIEVSLFNGIYLFSSKYLIKVIDLEGID